MNNTARKEREVIKFDDYINKKKNIKEPKDTIESNKSAEEKKELLKQMLSEFLESDYFVTESNEKEETIVTEDKKVIKNKENVNTIETNICDNCKEVEVMKLKAKQPIPKAIIVYIVMSSISFGIFLTIFIIDILLKIKIISLESCIVGIISTLGLLSTAIVSINDWRNFLKNVE